jgi:hypothetical protein
MKLISCLIGMLLFSTVTFCQEFIDLSGKVFDGENQAPLMDCHIYVKGTNIGTISGKNGEFSLNIPWKYAENSITVSYVGYAGFEQKLSDLQSHELKISMTADIIVLDEVVFIHENKFLVDQAIKEVMTEYDDREMMLADFYTRLFELDKDYTVLKNLISDAQIKDYLNQ